ncbi:MAG: hypothetical protein IAF58_17525 [Leptolyngbya sp.]|nr:hypothetical protein [Candidatus Melainabacteria bacterium]
MLCIAGFVNGCSTSKANDASEEAKALLQNLKYNELVLLCEQNLKSDPNNPEYLAYLGVGHAGLKNYKLAKDALEKAITLDAKNAWYYTKRAEAYSELGEYEKGLLDANRAIEIDPKYTLAMATKAKLYLASGRTEESLDSARQALAIDKNFWQATEYVLVASMINGKSEEAIETAEKLIAQFPSAAIGYTDKAACLLVIDQPVKAKVASDKALAVAPNDIRTLLVSALLAARRGDEKIALKQLDKAEKLENGGTIALRHRAYTFLFLKKNNEAIKVCNSIISKETEIAKDVTANKPFSTGIAYRIRAEAYKRLKLDKQAESDMKKALSLGYQKRSFVEQYLKLH